MEESPESPPLNRDWELDRALAFREFTFIMKKSFLAAAVLWGVAQVALADLRIPGSVFEIDKLEEAKTKASQEKMPLIFVYTDPGTS